MLYKLYDIVNMLQWILMKHFLRYFWISAALTLILGGIIGWYGGVEALWLFVVLTILEITFSFDNAVVNSRVLARMSDFWQKLFLTVGIFFAVFVVRFLLPVFIVMMIGGISFNEVLNLAFHHPEKYAELLHSGMHSIDAFGGAFLLLIGLGYFFDREKDIHWLRIIEQTLSRAARLRHIHIYLMILLTIVLYFTVPRGYSLDVLVAAALGIVLHTLLAWTPKLFEPKTKDGVKKQVGMAAFASFIYLNILDASFSLDGVIGAFAITTSVLLIVAGLGAGALWVRSLTVQLVRAGTLGKYRYLEHGAHWAILALGCIMLAKLYGFTPPEWATGSIGLVAILAAIISSIFEKRSASLRPENRA